MIRVIYELERETSIDQHDINFQFLINMIQIIVSCSLILYHVSLMLSFYIILV